MDFFKTYADRTHHGKEEDIFSHSLRKTVRVSNSGSHGRINLGAWIRKESCSGIDGKERKIVKCDDRELAEFLNNLEKLIEKEGKHFFYDAMEYFSEEEWKI